MKRLIMFCLSFAMPFLFFGCKKQVTIIADEFFENATRKTLETVRKNPYFGMSEEQKKQRRFYNALYSYHRNLENVITFLDSGFDPNYCYGECGWIDSNPLLLLTEITPIILYGKKDKYGSGKEPDIVLLNLLVDYGGNIHKYPYIWAMIYRNGNFLLTGLYKNEAGRIQDKEKSFVDDCNRVLKAFLDNGANINAKGNHIAFDWQTYKEKLPYEEFVKLCDAPEATTPLYEAIKKGMVWESQVDLLLEYGAILDESCREAAKLSGDEAMIRKIEKLLQSRKS